MKFYQQYMEEKMSIDEEIEDMKCYICFIR
jgi:hypothetical protein